jgi:hypothetical protein
MIRIPYPKEKSSLLAFEQMYIAHLKNELDKNPTINTVLYKVKLPSGIPLTWEYLLTAPFYELADLHTYIMKVSKGNKKRLKALTNYKKMQPSIAKFFMHQKEIELSSCYYCNIDSIYSFSEIGDFKDGLDLIQRANFNQLCGFPDIGEKTAFKIVQKRNGKQFTSIADCPVPQKVRDAILNFDIKYSHNHFTLDHFYFKDEFPYLSLCLYNFVPSCYACNSKFKKTGQPYVKSAKFSSPTSEDYSFDKDVSFKLYFHRSDETVMGFEDFSIVMDIANNHDSHEAFIHLFKLRGRYVAHKNEVLRLAKLRVEYPDSKLKELADAVGVTVEEMRKHIFGKEIFENGHERKALVKFRKDIARNIKLLP